MATKTKKPDNSVEKARKNQGGSTKWKPGQSGNPKGMPKGTRHKITQMAQGMLDGQGEELIRKCVQMAIDCDTAAMRLCIERIIPTQKSATVRFNISPMKKATDLPAVTEAISKAVANGEIDPRAGEQVSRIIERHLKALELSDLEKRLTALEERKA